MGKKLEANVQKKNSSIFVSLNLNLEAHIPISRINNIAYRLPFL